MPLEDPTLTGVIITIENNMLYGSIDIHSEAASEGSDDITKIIIKRFAAGAPRETGTPETTLTITIQSANDLEFNLRDITTVSGKEYDYYVEVYHGDALPEIKAYSGITCILDGLFIGNFNAQYVAGTNHKTTVNRNQQIQYVTTLASKYPYRISNSDTDFYTGTASGLFLELTEDNKSFKSDTFHEFSQKVIDFIADGTEKILKTHDGLVFYVGIDSQPHYIYSEFWGMNAIEFNWTQIDDLPEGMAVLS